MAKKMDENLADLGESDDEEDFVFPPAERRVITQPVDLSVQTLVEQWKSGLLHLPDIQREYVWDNGKASRLVESLILNIPIPVLYFAETDDAKYEIIDGHQRVRSIVRFLDNEFILGGLGVLREYRGMRFHQLPAKEQRFLRMRTLRAIIISADSHPNMKFEIFERLNTGSISLNAQELRNSIYRGNANKLLRSLAKNADLRALIGNKSPRPRMVDEELILRFFALRHGLGAYRTPLKRFLNNFMDDWSSKPDAQLADDEAAFTRTIARVRDELGTAAFRVTNADGTPTESVVNRAIFDAQMLAFSWIENDPGQVDIPHVRHEIASLFGQAEFLDSVRRATGDRSRTFRRLRETANALRRAGVVVNVPFDLEA
jgi:hypothetical protein